MTNECLNCKTKTKNPKFCSKKCCAVLNNKIFPKKKKKKNFCLKCKLEILSRNKFCKTCHPNFVDWDNVTLEDMYNKRSYQKNSRIRDLARKIYFKNKDINSLKCEYCGYNKHIEVCHILPINSFDKKSKISEVNHISNLIGLCPNCHWELDNIH